MMTEADVIHWIDLLFNDFICYMSISGLSRKHTCTHIQTYIVIMVFIIESIIILLYCHLH